MSAQQKPSDTAAVLEKIAAMKEEYRAMAQRLHEIILEAVPELQPRVWYGMPGYAKNKSGPVLVFFRADKYLTFGKTESAYFELEEKAEDQLMPSSYFLKKLDAATEKRIAEIVKKAVQ